MARTNTAARSRNKTLTIILGVIFVIMFLFLAGGQTSSSYSGSSSSTGQVIANEQQIQQQRTQELLDDYNRYINLWNSDVEKLRNLYNTWVNAYNNAIKDNQLTSSEVNQMKNAIEEYAYEYKVVNQHLTNFKNFIITNEQDLEAFTTTDTFQTKTNIDDTIIQLENNINRMKISTEDLITTYQQQQEQLQNILQILLGLI